MQIINVFKRLNYIFSKKQKVNLVILILIIIIGSGFELLGLVAIMPLVEIITNPELIKSKKEYLFFYNFFNIENEKQFIVLFLILLILIYLVKNAYLLFMYDRKNKFTYNNSRIVSMKLMRSYLGQKYEFFLTKNVSELQRNVTNDTNMLFAAVSASVELLAEITTILFMFVYLVILDKTISLGILFILLLFSFVFLRLVKNKSSRYGKLLRNATVDMNKWLRQSFEGIKEIKIANSEDYYIERTEDAYRTLSKALCRQEFIKVSPRPIFEAVCVSSLLVIVGGKIVSGVNLSYFIPVISVMAVAAFRLLPAFGRVTAHINNIIFNASAVENVFSDLKEVEKLNDAYARIENESKIVFTSEINVKNIVFSYLETNRPVINNLSLDIKKNTAVAFIGSTGSGKTTLADIILGLLEPQEGQILVDGMAINSNPLSWHNLVGYIPQNIYLIDDTIRNNVVFGIPESEETEENIWKALESAQLSEFVRELDQGLDTVVGERGVRLSGGQRQRIGIARALFLNPEILILDEATSALDNETESAVMTAIEQLKGNRTLIIIAHRLSTIKNCDVIYEIKDGKAYKKEKKDIFN